jgi:hypothetical protein
MLGESNVNGSGEDSPVEESTTTSLAPGSPSGQVHTMREKLQSVMETFVPPIVTVPGSAAKSDPTIVIGNPPTVGPLGGEMSVIEGGAASAGATANGSSDARGECEQERDAVVTKRMMVFLSRGQCGDRDK